MTIIAASPKATKPTENQKGSPKIYNSQPTINALKTIGKTIASNMCLQNMMQRHASNVAAVPIGISKAAVGEKQFAIKHPSVKPITYFLLKKQNKTNNSDIRN